MPAPTIRRDRTLVEGQAPREEQARQTGQSERYVGDEDAPSRALVTSLRRALAEHFPRWGELAPELAANSGPRWGEQFQLTAHDVHLDGCGTFGPAHVHVDWQVDGSGSDDHPRGRRVRPKNGTTRVVPVATDCLRVRTSDGASMSLRVSVEGTETTYECRTATTDLTSRARMSRYWWLIRPFAYILRAVLRTIRGNAETHA
jgi:hypothetical protein